jgi:hypothetical protein
MSGRADSDAINVIRPYQSNGGNSTHNPGNAGGSGSGSGNGDGNVTGAPGVSTGQGAGAPENADAAAKAAREAAAAATAATAAGGGATSGAAVVVQPTPRAYYISEADVGHYPGDEGVPSGRHSPASKDLFPLYDTRPLSGIGAGEDGDAYGTPFIDDRTKLQQWKEYVAYYVPIIQWLPKYKCASPPETGWPLMRSGIHSQGFVCGIDIGQYLHPHVSFLRCVISPSNGVAADM